MRFIKFITLLHLFLFSQQALSAKDIKSDITKILKSPVASKSEYSIYIKNIENGSVIFEKDSDKKLILASVSKLFTSAAALHYLEKDYKFKTNAYLQNGNLIIEGRGDPFMVAENFRLFTAKLARKLKSLGKTEITGDLLGVNGFFDNEERGENRKSRSTTRPYNSSVSDLSLNFNSMSIEVHPTLKVGEKAHIFQVPSENEMVSIENKTKTTGGSHNSLKINRNGNSEKYTITGNIGLRSEPVTVYASVNNPKMHFLGCLKTLLSKNGIKITGETKVSSSVKLQNSSKILSYEGTPIDRAIKLLNRYSNNFMADQIFKTIAAEKKGVPGSFKNGEILLDQFLSSIGLDTKQAKITNGSGLTNINEASAKAVVKLLEVVRKNFKNYPELLYSLTGGNIEGTGKTRFLNLNRRDIAPSVVRFKTGTLFKKHTVSAIAGYTKGKSGNLIAFAILLNRKNTSNSSLISKFRSVQDSIISSVLSY